MYSQVCKDDLEASLTPSGSSKAQLNHPLVNQYSLTLGQDLGHHDTKSLIKCVETLSFIVRDAAHVTPDNFELCVRAIRVFVEASLNGGEKYTSSILIETSVMMNLYSILVPCCSP